MLGNIIFKSARSLVEFLRMTFHEAPVLGLELTEWLNRHPIESSEFTTRNLAEFESSFQCYLDHKGTEEINIEQIENIKFLIIQAYRDHLNGVEDGLKKVKLEREMQRQLDGMKRPLEDLFGPLPPIDESNPLVLREAVPVRDEYSQKETPKGTTVEIQSDHVTDEELKQWWKVKDLEYSDLIHNSQQPPEKEVMLTYKLTEEGERYLKIDQNVTESIGYEDGELVIVVNMGIIGVKFLPSYFNQQTTFSIEIEAVKRWTNDNGFWRIELKETEETCKPQMEMEL